MEMMNPAHPGEFVSSELLEPLGLTVTSAAQVLGIGRPALSAFLNGRSSLSPELAIRIEKAFGIKMDFLMRMQLAHQLAQARRSAGRIKVKRFKPKAA
jgi:addiction module HigA family antidote